MELRKPTEEELQKLYQWALKQDYDGDTQYLEEVKRSFSPCAIIVVDNFTTAVKIMLVVWDTGPQHIDAFKWLGGEMQYVEPDPIFVEQRMQEDSSWEAIFKAHDEAA